MTADFIALNHLDQWPDAIDAPAVLLSCTQGSDGVDPKYAERRQKAENNKFVIASLHVVAHRDVKWQMKHFEDISAPKPGQRIFLELGEDAELSDLRTAVTYWWAWGSQTRGITVRGGDRLRELLGDLHDPVLQRADLWILDNDSDEPEFPRRTWASWSLREAPVTGKDPPASFFAGDREQFLEWLG